jgi:hypothetical protein
MAATTATPYIAIFMERYDPICSGMGVLWTAGSSERDRLRAELRDGGNLSGVWMFVGVARNRRDGRLPGA